MKTISAADANRYFSAVLKDIAAGEQILVVSRGKPVAKIVPVNEGVSARKSARAVLLSRLSGQMPTGRRDWTRDELYE